MSSHNAQNDMAAEVVPRLRPRLYFAHPIGTYGSRAETEALTIINQRFAGYDIINPGDVHHVANGTGNFDYYRALVEGAEALIYLPFADGKIGAGIAGEVRTMRKKHGQIYELKVNREGQPTGQVMAIESDLDSQRVLSREKTGERNKAASGRSV